MFTTPPNGARRCILIRRARKKAAAGQRAIATDCGCGTVFGSSHGQEDYMKKPQPEVVSKSVAPQWGS
jgi:hypothetical protein